MATPLNRAHLMQTYLAALAAVNGSTCVQRSLAQHHLAGEVSVVAIGKAASAMLQGAQAGLGQQIGRALLINLLA